LVGEVEDTDVVGDGEGAVDEAEAAEVGPLRALDDELHAAVATSKRPATRPPATTVRRAPLIQAVQK
jgi:hypothetical protein